jgi:hypothetical protein
MIIGIKGEEEEGRKAGREKGLINQFLSSLPPLLLSSFFLIFDHIWIFYPKT